ncbi:MAG: thermonuclease family protein [Planctomycetota bacterium]|nr:thermonuclease family protein [Planctomycetota bacterium]
MRTVITHALACAGGSALALAVQFLLEKGASAPPANAQKVIDLRVADGGVYRVRRVVDGDTIVLENGLHVRYQGVNTPEAGRWVKDPAPLSAEATARNRALVDGRFVRLALGPEPLDEYGRVVARVRVTDEPKPGAPAGPGTDVEALLLKEGLARVFGLGLTPADREALAAAESEARAAKAGQWGLERSAEAEAAFPFCASSSGEVFHRSACAQARRIVAAHYQGYRSEEEARASGRRPCSQCMKDAPKP